MKNKKSLGQHWLQNRAILEEIAELAVVPEVATCIEIGPGLGTLTSSLLRRFTEVIAIEYDSELARKLPASFPGKNLQVVQADILTTDLSRFTENHKYCIVGNIPYYITSPIIKKTLALNPKPVKIVLLMQKEVAQRVAAMAGDYSLLGLMVQNLAKAELGPVVKAAEFTPPPKVDSQVLILTPFAGPQIPPQCLDLAKKGFSNPRKKLAGVLAGGEFSKEQWRIIFSEHNISPDARAQDLTLQDWQNLYQITQKSPLSDKML